MRGLHRRGAWGWVAGGSRPRPLPVATGHLAPAHPLPPLHTHQRLPVCAARPACVCLLLFAPPAQQVRPAARCLAGGACATGARPESLGPATLGPGSAPPCALRLLASRCLPPHHFSR